MAYFAQRPPNGCTSSAESLRNFPEALLGARNHPIHTALMLVNSRIPWPLSSRP